MAKIHVFDLQPRKISDSENHLSELSEADLTVQGGGFVVAAVVVVASVALAAAPVVAVWKAVKSQQK
jgi:formylmethanofuran dehydrogenase subunit A